MIRRCCAPHEGVRARVRLKIRTLTGTGEATLGAMLGRGGEGAVYEATVRGVNLGGEVVAKIYHDPSGGDRERKTLAMLKNPPDSESVAWNLGQLYEGGVFRGFLMPKLEFSRYQTFSEVASVVSRRRVAPQFTVLYAYTMVKNLCVAMESFHAAGHRVGDVNESNALVGADATVMLVDADSAQISDEGRVFPCTVGKPEYTAPELTHGSLRDSVRTVESDMFGFMVLAYQAFTGGSHPARAVYRGEGDPLDTVEKIRAGVYPALLPGSAPVGYSAPRVPVDAIPASVRALLVDGLSVDPGRRPSFRVVRETLEGVLGRFQQCGRRDYHYFDSLEGECPWCRITVGCPELDVFAPEPVRAAPEQSALPAVRFSADDSDGVPVRRVSTKPSAAPASSAGAGRSPSSAAGRRTQTVAAAGSGSRPAAANTGAGSRKTSTSTPQRAAVSSAHAGGVLYPPEKSLYKRKLVVLDGAGQRVQRPSLLSLLGAGRFGLVGRALEAELPQWVLPVWSRYSRVPRVLPVLLGGLVALGVLLFVAPSVMGALLGVFPAGVLSPQVVGWVEAAPFFMGVVAIVCLWVSVLVRRFMWWRQARSVGASVVFERWGVCAVVPVLVGVVWSIPMFIMGVVLLVLGLLWFVVDAFRRER